MSDINELKRNAIEAFTQAIFKANNRTIEKKDITISNNMSEIKNPKLDKTKISITLNNNFEVIDKLKDYDNIEKIYVDISLRDDVLIDVIEKIIKINKKPVIKLPKVIRYKDIDVIKNIFNILENKKTKCHYQVESLEGLALIKESISYDRIIIGPGLYSFNDFALNFMSKYSRNSFYPYEMSLKDIKSFKVKNNCFMIYGHIPVMISAQCVEKNTSVCSHNDKVNYLKNDDGEFLAVCRCKFCHNVIYSAKPVAYFEYIDELIKNGVEEFNMEFLHETQEEIIKIINNYSNVKISRINGYLQKGGVI
jgi:putative protease